MYAACVWWNLRSCTKLRFTKRKTPVSSLNKKNQTHFSQYYISKKSKGMGNI